MLSFISRGDDDGRRKWERREAEAKPKPQLSWYWPGRGSGSGVSEWARRVRELREDEGWEILTHNDSVSLKPGQYLVKETPPQQVNVSFARGISTRLRAEVLDRNGFTCQMCGLVWRW